MSAHNLPYGLKKLSRRYRAIRLTECIAWSIAAAGIAYALSTLLDLQTIVSSISVGIIALGLLALRKKLFHTNISYIISYLNSTYPTLEESADLLTTDDEPLISLQRLQQQRVKTKFNLLFPDIKFPHQLGRASMLMVVSWLVSGFLITDVTQDQSTTPTPELISLDSATTISNVPAGVKSVKVTITPPTYTGIKSFQSKSHDLKVPEGSVVNWNYEFDKPVDVAALKIAPKDSFALKQASTTFTLAKKISRSSIYQLVWKDKSSTHFSDFHRIEVIPDRAPDVQIIELPQSFDLSYNDKLQVNVKTKLNDDYQLTDGYIIATVAKGSGESVKFREEKIPFSSPSRIAGKDLVANRMIDLKKLGLEPGDEIYFYAEASDNRKPVPNRSRTQTYFITLLDTAQQDIIADAGLGVDLMPEYFRSQRQIIIDTEKLIRNKRALEKQVFSATSNELGYDQKVLRLKYGEFLGEEFESELAPSDEVEVEVSDLVGQEEDENMAEKFGHAHDKDNEHNLVEEKKTGDSHGHEHDNGPKDPDEKEDPLKDFVHAHDDPEEATFFLQSIRTKLKAALTEMWDAELYLRLYEPEKSLPYQYKALRLLKEVSNDSRIYVHKTGFDPPPLKEEKRLTGDLTEIKSNAINSDRLKASQFPAIRKAALLLDNKLQLNSYAISAADKALLSNAGNELAGIAIRKPGEFLSALSLLRRLINDSQSFANEQNMQLIAEAFWNAIPQEQQTGKQSALRHPMDESFIKQLEQLNHE